MNKARRKYDAIFKAKVAIEAIRERETLSELSAKYEVSPVMISRWKKEFIDNSAAAFETPKRDDKAMEKQKDLYLRKIGDLEMQLDFAGAPIRLLSLARMFAKRVSQKLGIEIPAAD